MLGTPSASRSAISRPGIGPAVLIAGMLAIYSFFRGQGGTAQHRPRSSFADARHALREGIWRCRCPSSCSAASPAACSRTSPRPPPSASSTPPAVVELFIHRELPGWKDLLLLAMLKSVTMMGALLLIIAISFTLNAFMVEKGAAEAFLKYIREQQLSAFGFLLAINIFLIVTGALMDSIPRDPVLFTPLIAPAAVALGIDPLHLGIVFIVNMEVSSGYVAPPIATNLFVSAQLFQRPFGQVVNIVMPTLNSFLHRPHHRHLRPDRRTGPVYWLKGKSFYQPFGGHGQEVALDGADVVLRLRWLRRTRALRADAGKETTKIARQRAAASDDAGAPAPEPERSSRGRSKR